MRTVRRFTKQKDETVLREMMTIGFLTISNTFMTLAWYGHLKFGEMKWFNKLGIVSIIFISWGIAFFRILFSSAGKQNRIQKLRRTVFFSSA